MISHTTSARRDQNLQFNWIYNILICLFGELRILLSFYIVRKTLFVDESIGPENNTMQPLSRRLPASWSFKYPLAIHFCPCLIKLAFHLACKLHFSSPDRWARPVFVPKTIVKLVARYTWLLPIEMQHPRETEWFESRSWRFRFFDQSFWNSLIWFFLFYFYLHPN